MHKTSLHLARCPHCDSAFEVSPEELELAYGAVRCGECMKIFNANFHRLDADPESWVPDQDEKNPADPIPTLHEHYHQVQTSATTSPAEELQAPEPLEQELAAAEQPEPTAAEDLPEEASLAQAEDQEVPSDEPVELDDLEELAPAEDQEAPGDELGGLEQPQETDEEATEDDELLDAELRAFEAELTTALTDPETIDTEEMEASFSESATDPDSELTTEAREPPRKKKPQPANAAAETSPTSAIKRYGLIAASLIAVVLVAAAGWMQLAPSEAQYLVAEEVRITPSTSPTKMDIRFQLRNTSPRAQDWPDFKVELLNLSGQIVASQEVDGASLEAARSFIDVGQSLDLRLEVERPATFVQNARILPLESR